jgi:hypothetical protein
MTEPTAKPKKILSEDQLANLAKARERAVEVRRQKAQERGLIKLADKQQHNERVKKAIDVLQPPPKPVESESDDEDEVIVVRKPKPKPKAKKQKIVYEEEYEDEEPKAPVPPQRPQPTPQQMAYQNQLQRLRRDLFG